MTDLDILLRTLFFSSIFVYFLIAFINYLILKNEKPNIHGHLSFTKLFSFSQFEPFQILKWEINGENLKNKRRVNKLSKFLKLILITMLLTIIIGIFI
jgi:ABC-type sugar transport system permease subunit